MQETDDIYRSEVWYCCVDRVTKWSRSGETKTTIGCCDSVISLPVTVTRVPPACGPNSGHTLLTVGPASTSRNMQRLVLQKRQFKPHPHQQRRSDTVKRYKSNHSFEKVKHCFDIVAVFDNNVWTNFSLNFVLLTKSKQTEHVQFVSTM